MDLILQKHYPFIECKMYNLNLFFKISVKSHISSIACFSVLVCNFVFFFIYWMVVLIAWKTSARNFVADYYKFCKCDKKRTWNPVSWTRKLNQIDSITHNQIQLSLQIQVIHLSFPQREKNMHSYRFNKPKICFMF